MKRIVLNNKSNFKYDYITKYKEELEKIKTKNIELTLLPSVPYLSMFKDSKLKIGSQNFFSYNEGSFTGEINLEALKSMNINTVLVGHSERRDVALETFSITKEKIFKSLNAKFDTILCIGETKKGNTKSFIKKALKYYFKDLNEENIDYLTIAYEPVYAIGGFESVDTKQIKKVTEIIKKTSQKKFNKEIKVLYGGSVDPSNIQEIMNETDGVLVGSASKEIKTIKEMLKAVDKK